MVGSGPWPLSFVVLRPPRGRFRLPPSCATSADRSPRSTSSVASAWQSPTSGPSGPWQVDRAALDRRAGDDHRRRDRGQRCNVLPPRSATVRRRPLVGASRMSVFDNMAFSLMLAHLRTTEIRNRRVADARDGVRMVERAADPPRIGGQLGCKPKAPSGGQRRGSRSAGDRARAQGVPPRRAAVQPRRLARRVRGSWCPPPGVRDGRGSAPVVVAVAVAVIVMTVVVMIVIVVAVALVPGEPDHRGGVWRRRPGERRAGQRPRSIRATSAEPVPVRAASSCGIP